MSDEILGEFMRADVPAQRANYWRAIDQRLQQVEDERHTTSASDGSDIDGDQRRLTDMTVEPSPPTRSPLRRAWFLGIAAALVVALGLVAIPRIAPSGSVLDVGDRGFLGGLVGGKEAPLANRDHWHAVYGVWDCTLNDGAGDWVPEFQSNLDPDGIHSHGDGMVHIHPFSDAVAGTNAVLAVFARAMEIVIDDEFFELDDGRRLDAGESCDGGAAVPHVRKWQFDVGALNGEAPEIITDDLAGIRFENDREVWTIAFAPLDAEIPLPPSQRFDLLNDFAPPDIEYDPTTLTPSSRPTGGPPEGSGE